MQNYYIYCLKVAEITPSFKCKAGMNVLSDNPRIVVCKSGHLFIENLFMFRSIYQFHLLFQCNAYKYFLVRRREFENVYKKTNNNKKILHCISPV